MRGVNDTLQPDSIRSALARFWAESISIACTPGGMTLALPQTGADGWQLVVEIIAVSVSRARISDSGRVLGSLVAQGQSIDKPAFGLHLDAILRPASVERDGLELFRWLPLPIDPVDIHVFAEALVGVSHLSALHEPKIQTRDLTEESVQRILDDRGIPAKRGARLDGRIERGIRIDLLTETKVPIGIQILKRRNNVFEMMERWGFRWMDLRTTHPTLVPVMLYDRAEVHVDDRSRAIGESVCRHFGPWDDVDRIHQVLADAGATRP